MKSLKKNVLKDIEKIKIDRKLPEKIEKNIKERIISNWAICISIDILILVFFITSRYLLQSSATLVYNICSILFLTFTLCTFEIAYKKDSGKWAICGIELLVLSIFILFSPYIFLKNSLRIAYGLVTVITIYYSIKTILIYSYEKKRYFLEISDIPNIIKKESQDEKAKIEQEKLRKTLDKAKQNKQSKDVTKKKSTKANSKEISETKKTVAKKTKTGTSTKRATSTKTTKKNNTKSIPKKENNNDAEKTKTRKTTKRKTTTNNKKENNKENK